MAPISEPLGTASDTLDTKASSSLAVTDAASEASVIFAAGSPYRVEFLESRAPANTSRKAIGYRSRRMPFEARFTKSGPSTPLHQVGGRKARLLTDDNRFGMEHGVLTTTPTSNGSSIQQSLVATVGNASARTVDGSFGPRRRSCAAPSPRFRERPESGVPIGLVV